MIDIAWLAAIVPASFAVGYLACAWRASRAAAADWAEGYDGGWRDRARWEAAWRAELAAREGSAGRYPPATPGSPNQLLI